MVNLCINSLLNPCKVFISQSNWCLGCISDSGDTKNQKITVITPAMTLKKLPNDKNWRRSSFKLAQSNIYWPGITYYSHWWSFTLLTSVLILFAAVTPAVFSSPLFVESDVIVMMTEGRLSLKYARVCWFPCLWLLSRVTRASLSLEIEENEDRFLQLTKKKKHYYHYQEKRRVLCLSPNCHTLSIFSGVSQTKGRNKLSLSIHKWWVSVLRLHRSLQRKYEGRELCVLTEERTKRSLSRLQSVFFLSSRKETC